MDVYKHPDRECIYHPMTPCEDVQDDPENEHCLKCEWHSDCYEYQYCGYCGARNYDCDWTHFDRLGNVMCDECWADNEETEES